MWCLGHRFAAPDQTHVGIPEPDLLGATHHGLEPGPAEPVDGEGGGFDRAARGERHVTGEVDAVGGGEEHIAEDRLGHLRWIDGRATERSARGNRGELDGRDVLQRATKGAKRRSHAGQKYDLSHALSRVVSDRRRPVARAQRPLSGGSFTRLDLPTARRTEMPVDLELRATRRTLGDGHVLAAVGTERDRTASWQIASAITASSLRNHRRHGRTLRDCTNAAGGRSSSDPRRS